MTQINPTTAPKLFTVIINSICHEISRQKTKCFVVYRTQNNVSNQGVHPTIPVESFLGALRQYRLFGSFSWRNKAARIFKTSAKWQKTEQVDKNDCHLCHRALTLAVIIISRTSELQSWVTVRLHESSSVILEITFTAIKVDEVIMIGCQKWKDCQLNNSNNYARIIKWLSCVWVGLGTVNLPLYVLSLFIFHGFIFVRNTVASKRQKTKKERLCICDLLRNAWEMRLNV